MADSELPALPNVAAPAGTDICYIVTDPGGGSEADGKVTVTALTNAAALTGDVTKSAGSSATTIANDAVTFAKMQNIATDRLLGRETAGSGDIEEITLGGGLTLASTTVRQSVEFQCQGGSASFNPADSLTYAIGNQPNIAPTTTASYFFIVPRAGTIARAYVLCMTSGTLSSASNSTFSVVNASAVTSESIGTLQQTAALAAVNNTAMTLAVSAGDLMYLAYTTPAWATNPTAVTISAMIEVLYT